MPVTDSIKAVTISFILTLCEMNLKGRNVLISLRILMKERFNEVPTKEASIMETMTIKKSS